MDDNANEFSLALTDTLLAAISKLNILEEKICVVCDDGGRVRRTVTDGDVRRFLLAGGSLDDTVASLPEKDPILSLHGASDAKLLEEMASNDVNAIVLVDPNGTPQQIRTKSSLQSKIMLSPPHLGANEIAYVHEAFESNWVAPAGPNLTAFEKKLARYTGTKHTLAVSSGTAALHLALRVLGIGAGHRVYVSDLTFIASLQPILYENAIPVLIDSEPKSWTMSPVALERKLAEDKANGELPAAIIVVHLYGQVADMPAIMSLAEKFGIQVIEDAAESLGATINSKPCGSHGILSVFSFNGNKMITHLRRWCVGF